MNIFRISINTLVLTVLLAALSGCGGSGSSSIAITSPTTNSAPSVSQGDITGFGSFFLNEIEYESKGGTAFRMDDQNGSEEDLRKGMRIHVKGNNDDSTGKGSADEVVFDDDVEGPIAKIDTAQSLLVVLGLTVIVDAATIIKDHHASRFDDADDNITPRLSLFDLNAGEIVEVSGLWTAQGELLASRIERKTAAFVPGVTQVEVKGTVSGYDGIQMKFNLGVLLVDYSMATQIEGTIADGVFVEAKGTLNTTGDTLTAFKVEAEDDLMKGIGNEKVEIEGLITSITSPTIFEVNGQPVDASSAVFLQGAPTDVALNIRVEVEGHVVLGILMAKKVKFRGNRVKIEAHIQGAPSSNKLTVIGLEVHFNKLTELKNGPLQAGDPVKVEGFLSEGMITANKIEHVNEIKFDDIILQGPVDQNSIVPPVSYAVLGVAVDCSMAKFEDENEVQITAVEFFNRLGPNTLAKARGIFNGIKTLAAEKAELED